jgi:hypothetical protein
MSQFLTIKFAVENLDCEIAHLTLRTFLNVGSGYAQVKEQERPLTFDVDC